MFKAKAELPDDTLGKSLKAAADALRQIECMTANDPTLDRVDTRVINRIALNGWRKTQEETK